MKTKEERGHKKNIERIEKDNREIEKKSENIMKVLNYFEF
jgi:hypothetical protein